MFYLPFVHNFFMVFLNFILDKSNGKIYIMMEARLVALFKKADEYEVQSRFKGETLKGKTYLPLFSYYAHVCSIEFCHKF